MNKEKQIEELVIALTESQHEFDKAWHECLQNNGKMPDRENVFYAKFLIDKDYRKADEVAREIFEEIDKIVLAGIEKDESFRERMHTNTDRSYFEGGANSQRKILTLVRMLKKKYTENKGE